MDSIMHLFVQTTTTTSTIKSRRRLRGTFSRRPTTTKTTMAIHSRSKWRRIIKTAASPLARPSLPPSPRLPRHLLRLLQPPHPQLPLRHPLRRRLPTRPRPNRHRLPRRPQLRLHRHRPLKPRVPRRRLRLLPHLPPISAHHRREAAWPIRSPPSNYGKRRANILRHRRCPPRRRKPSEVVVAAVHLSIFWLNSCRSRRARL